jgi:outer membrane receptor protein involved in Fe transport
MAIAACSTPSLVFSAEANDNKIHEVIVEGQAITTNISEFAIDQTLYGTQVQLINDAEIDTGGFTNFGELAAGLIRGANIGYSPDEGEFTIRLDGGTDRDTLLLVNGVPTFDRGTPLEDIWGATAIDPRMIESVEVFRGGQSLYYGGNGGLGVVNVIYKQPEAGEEVTGEIGFYGGSFKTREIYGNMSMPLFARDDHALMVFGRSYETDAHEIFSKEAHVDNVIALGGFQEFPYTYNLLGMKYVWAIDAETEFRAGYQFATVDFHDSFPNFTIYQPNFTEFPIFDMSFKTRFNERHSLEVEGYYSAPTLKNTELDARICNIPRLQDLPDNIQVIAREQGIDRFTTAAQFEEFAAGIDNLPAGCVTNPYGNLGRAASSSTGSIYVDENGVPYGTINNPFPIGAPIGTVIQSTANFGTNVPVKGFGSTDQFEAGYIDYGLNTRLKTTWSEWFETVVGAQYVTHEDNSDHVYGMSDEAVESIGLYSDLRFNLPIFEGSHWSVAGRQDFNDPFEDEFIWKLGVRQDFAKGIYLRGNGGTSYSNPRLTEIGARGDDVTNPSLETQGVETYSLGLGMNGEAFTGTFNVELGYFNTEINNMFGSASIDRVCAEVAALNGETLNLVTNIERPDEFCRLALTEYNAGSITGNETAYFNQNVTQDIEGYTLDIAFDFDQWQLDLTFTDMESERDNPLYQKLALLEGTGEELNFVVPGDAGYARKRQVAETPEWSASALLTYTPTDRWTIALNPKWQGPEWAYAGNTNGRLVNAAGERVSPDLNFGDYMVVNASVQYYMGVEKQHRFLLRVVNLLDEDYYERASASADKLVSRAAVRGELTSLDADYYYQYGWNGKPQSFWLQYEYKF